MSSEAIAARATNQSGVSVGTSLALETIIPNWPVFDRERVAPDTVSLHSFKRVWINLRTLARNMYNAMEDKEKVDPEALGDAVAEEAWTVVQAIQTASANSVGVKLYLVDYSRLGRIFPLAKLRVPTTEKQITVDRMMRLAMLRAQKVLETNHPGFLHTTGPRIDPGSYGETLMLTHMAVDLLNAQRFGSLTLLESHTGQVKEKNLWYTKLFSGKSLSIIPFCEMSIQVYGDDHSFSPMNITVKRAVTDIAEKNHWSWMTSTGKMRADLMKHPDASFKLEIVKLFDRL